MYWHLGAARCDRGFFLSANRASIRSFRVAGAHRIEKRSGVMRGAAMIKVKHLMDAVEPDDGARFWVEPIGLTRDLRQWCSVGATLPQVAPPSQLTKWFDRHPEAYDVFRGCYHDHLAEIGRAHV